MLAARNVAREDVDSLVHDLNERSKEEYEQLAQSLKNADDRVQKFRVNSTLLRLLRLEYEQ